jgi:DNA-binding MarR family transcriptional regulator
MKIEEAIKQKSFPNEALKANINVLYTASFLSNGINQELRPFGITSQQFNILRILRGLHPQPSSVKELSERMIDKSSNASRLVDKLVEKKLVERIICPLDRRQVEVTISEQGLGFLNEVSAIVESKVREQFRTLSQLELKELNRLLDTLRG